MHWMKIIYHFNVCYLSEISILVKANFNLWHRLITLGSLVFIKYIMFEWELLSMINF